MSQLFSAKLETKTVFEKIYHNFWENLPHILVILQSVFWLVAVAAFAPFNKHMPVLALSFLKLHILHKDIDYFQRLVHHEFTLKWFELPRPSISLLNFTFSNFFSSFLLLSTFINIGYFFIIVCFFLAFVIRILHGLQMWMLFSSFLDNQIYLHKIKYNLEVNY